MFKKNKVTVESTIDESYTKGGIKVRSYYNGISISCPTDFITIRKEHVNDFLEVMRFYLEERDGS